MQYRHDKPTIKSHVIPKYSLIIIGTFNYFRWIEFVVYKTLSSFIDTKINCHMRGWREINLLLYTKGKVFKDWGFPLYFSFGILISSSSTILFSTPCRFLPRGIFSERKIHIAHIREHKITYATFWSTNIRWQYSLKLGDQVEINLPASNFSIAKEN